MKIQVTDIKRSTVLHSITTGVGAYVITRNAYRAVQKIKEYRHRRKEEEEALEQLRELQEVDQLLKELRELDPSVTR